MHILDGESSDSTEQPKKYVKFEEKNCTWHADPVPIFSQTNSDYEPGYGRNRKKCTSKVILITSTFVAEFEDVQTITEEPGAWKNASANAIPIE